MKAVALGEGSVKLNAEATANPVERSGTDPADLVGAEHIEATHLNKAIGYRALDRNAICLAELTEIVNSGLSQPRLSKIKI